MRKMESFRWNLFTTINFEVIVGITVFVLLCNFVHGGEVGEIRGYVRFTIIL